WLRSHEKRGERAEAEAGPVGGEVHPTATPRKQKEPEDDPVYEHAEEERAQDPRKPHHRPDDRCELQIAPAKRRLFLSIDEAAEEVEEREDCQGRSDAREGQDEVYARERRREDESQQKGGH